MRRFLVVFCIVALCVETTRAFSHHSFAAEYDADQHELAGRAHTILTGRQGGFGGYQGIRPHSGTGVLEGASDHRRDGLAIGY